MPDAPKYLLLGEILRPHGVRGEMRLRVMTDYPERIADLDRVYLSDDANDVDPRPYAVEGMRMSNEYGLLKLKGIDDRNDAERLRQLFVMVDMEHAVPLEEGEFYLYQIIGAVVTTKDGVTLGPITDVLETGANDVYVVDSEQYGEVLIPVTEHTILETDIDGGRVVVDLPEGLLPNL